MFDRAQVQGPEAVETPGQSSMEITLIEGMHTAGRQHASMEATVFWMLLLNIVTGLQCLPLTVPRNSYD